MYRSRKTTKRYNPTKSQTNHQYLDGTLPCPFCYLDDRPIVETGETMLVIPASAPYEFWDQHAVSEHLMIVPKRHVEHLGKLTDAERVELLELIAQYEDAGYSSYNRSHANSERTVPHKHIHLFKNDGPRIKALLYLAKPYLVWHR